MHPLEILRVAEGLRATNRPECCRVAVGRAYYAAHLSVVRFLEEVGWRVTRKGYGHAEARALLTILGNPILDLAAENLSNLYEWRVAADYRLDDPWAESPDNAELACKAAVDVVNAAFLITQSPLKSQMFEAMGCMFVSRWACKMGGGKPWWI